MRLNWKNNFLIKKASTATLYHLSFVRESVFYSKNIQHVCNFYGTDLHVNVSSGVFRTQSNIYNGASLKKSKEIFIVDVRLL